MKKYEKPLTRIIRMHSVSQLLSGSVSVSDEDAGSGIGGLSKEYDGYDDWSSDGEDEE